MALRQIVMVLGVVVALLMAIVVNPSYAKPRVISLAPSLTELMQDLGQEDLLVGILDGGERPAGLEHLPSIGQLGVINYEQLYALQPSLILYWPGSLTGNGLQQLQATQIPIFNAAAADLDEFAALFQQLGNALNVPSIGKSKTLQAQEKIAQIRQTYAHLPPLRVFYQVWDQPMYTLGGKQIMTDILSACGAENVFAHLPLLAPQVSIESVIQANPDVIVLGHQGLASGWSSWQQLEAVKNQRLIELPDADVERPSWQMLEAMDALCQALRH